MPDVTQLTVAGLTFDATIAGPADGEPVVLLHGFPQTSALWAAQQATLAAAGYRAVAFDQRGCSPAARPLDDAAYRLPVLGGDVLGVADALGAERFHVVGHDWGGVVAWWVASRAAPRTRSLTVLSTPHPRALGRALRSFDQRVRSSYFSLFRSRFGPGALGGRGAVGLRALLTLSGLPRDRTAALVERARRDRGWLPAALAWYRAIDGRSFAEVGDIDVPTLFVWGAGDQALGPEAAYGTGTHVLGPYRFEPLPGVGHWLPVLAADVVNELLLEHLRARTVD
jgi:pimeloyl-ACP methyl ester carboxylesterase